MRRVPAPRTYEITVSGTLGELATAFAPHTAAGSRIRVEDADQAMLFSVLALVQELGLDLCEVRIVR
jgi:hypothetical protein